MFEEFRKFVKSELKIQKITYAQLAEKINMNEGTIRSFMSGHHESRSLAEKISDVLNLNLIYSNGRYTFRPRKYLSPIPYLNVAKEFELRMHLVNDEPISEKDAKRKTAEFIKNMTVDEISKWLSCKTFPIYPED